MKISTIWKAQQQSAGHAWREDSSVRMAWVVRGALFVATGWWLLLRWISQLETWQSQGTPALTLHLLFFCLVLWLPVGGLAMLGAFQQGFSTDEATVLLLLPIPAATRFRILLLQVLLKRVGQWLVLATVVLGAALTVVLKGQSAVWLSLLISGMLTAIALGTWLVAAGIRYLTGRRLLGLVCLVAVGAALVAWGLNTHMLTWPSGAPTWLPPLLTVGLLAVLVVMVGPIAKPAGTLYEAAFHMLQDQNGPRSRSYLPGSKAISIRVARQRTLLGALLFKGVLNQSRNPLLLVRLVMVVGGVLLFPTARHALFLRFHLPDSLLILGYLVLVMSLTVGEAITNAIAGEGERLALYLIAPVSRSSYLRSKLAVALLSILSLEVVVSAAITYQARLPLGDAILATCELLLCQLGGIGLLVWGSTWDADLSTLVEGPAQTMLQEDASISPRRLMLLNISLGLQLLCVALVWASPKGLGPVILAVVDAVVLAGAWRFGHRQLERLVEDP